MIRVQRHLPAPASLEKSAERGANAGKTELDLVLAAFAAYEQQLASLAPGAKPPRFSFEYQRYRDQEVKDTLTALFRGKCAYCEVRYAVSQPMDVEHWRPKAEIDIGAPEPIAPGYYWLAASWDNLLPSCIDCNRARKQHDVVEGREVTLGKANQFPLLDEATRRRRHDQPDSEAPSLINPCLDDPELLFEYTDEGVIIPRSATDPDRQRALDSIRVYALNRSDLVAERRELVRLIDHRLELVRQLGELRGKLEVAGEPDLAAIVEELMTIEIDALEALKAPERPFAGLARFLLAS